MSIQDCARILNPIKLVAWGELAMTHVGVVAVSSSYTIVIEDNDMADAIKKLEEAGFKQTPWSISTVDPAIAKTDPISQRVRKSNISSYAVFDAHTVRFKFPSNVQNPPQRLALLPSSYAHLATPSNMTSGSSSSHAPSEIPFDVEENIYWPHVAPLLESFIKVLLEENTDGPYQKWKSRLRTWCIAFLHGQLNLADDILDGSDDTAVRNWYDENTRRYTGGMDKTTNKRTGRR